MITKNIERKGVMRTLVILYKLVEKFYNEIKQKTRRSGYLTHCEVGITDGFGNAVFERVVL